MDKMQPTLSIDDGGTKVWRLDGKLHRLDGPAVEYPHGEKVWCMNGILHRTDGPAFEYPDGRKSWYLHNKSLSLDDWLDQNPNMTDEEKVMMKLKYG
jgi:hypothetical protein